MLTCAVYNCKCTLLQMSDDSGSAPGESPYIGKSRFHRNEYAVEHQTSSRPNAVVHNAVNGTLRTATTHTLRSLDNRAKSEERWTESVDGVTSDLAELKAVDEGLQKKKRAIELSK